MNGGDRDRGSGSGPDPDAVIVLYAGEGGFCSRTVRFVLDRRPDPRVRFAALQSSVGTRLLEAHGIVADLSTMVLIEPDRASVRSTAALRLLAYLGGAWPALRALLVVPRPIRDAVYGFVARRRHRLPGDSCEVPRDDMRARFLD